MSTIKLVVPQKPGTELTLFHMFKMDDKVLTFEEVKKLKVAELKDHLSRFGLQVSGLKADLIARLASYYESKGTQASEIGKSEEDVQDTSPQEADDAYKHNLAPVEAFRAEASVEHDLIDLDDEITEDIRDKDSAVSEPELVCSQNNRHIDSIVIADSPWDGYEESMSEENVPEEVVPVEPMQDDSSPVEQEVMMLQEVKPSPQHVSQPEHEVQSVNTEDNAWSSEPSHVVDPTEQDAITPTVVHVVDDMIVDIGRKEEDATIDTLSGARSHEKPGVVSFEDAQDDKREVDLDGASEVVEASETEGAQESEPDVVQQSERDVVPASETDDGQASEPEVVPEPEDVQVSEPEVLQPSVPEVVQEPEVLQPSEPEVVQEPEVLQPSVPEVVQEPEDVQVSEPEVLHASDPGLLHASDPGLLHASDPGPLHATETGGVQTETPASDDVLPEDSQMPSRDNADTEASDPQQTEVDTSSVRRKEIAAINTPIQIAAINTPPIQTAAIHTPPIQIAAINTPPIRASEVTPKRTNLERNTIPAGKVPRVDDLNRGSINDSRVGVRNLNHISEPGTRGDDSGYDVDHGEREDYVAAKAPRQVPEPSKKKKKKKKRRKKKSIEQEQVQEYGSQDDEGIEVEYIPDTLELDANDPIYAQFAQIFETFKLTDKTEDTKKDDVKEKKDDQSAETQKKDANDEAMDTDSDEDETDKLQDEQTGEKVEKLSKKKLKLKNRMSVAELKQHVHRPDVVEMHDVTAPDPKLLVYLKACRNTVPVPRHWCFKRKFLQGKRGIIKPPFQLPEFIQKTGIMEMREALQEKEDAKNMKAKMREKVRPKMGKIDIDYQKLHDAFFKWQTKPKMSIHGDLYYEGKEFETKLKQKKPGDLSEELRTALGMPTGQGSNLVPPPWLIAMQRYGPPPSYPNLKIPGLNAPIPEGASFGYHAGGWGKPPVDEHGRPLYGDVFGIQQTDMNLLDDDQVDSALWGELESESEESEESEEESEEEPADQSGLITPAETGLVTPSGLTSIPAGMETPDMIELRKRKNIEEAMEGGGEQPTLYTVLPEKRVGVGAAMMGSAHVYDLATAGAPTGTKKAPGGLSEGVEVALDPSELELDPAAMQARYDEQLREQQSVQKEDFSDMVAEHAARQQKKRKKTTDSGKAAKKYKEFKF